MGTLLAANVACLGLVCVFLTVQSIERWAFLQDGPGYWGYIFWSSCQNRLVRSFGEMDTAICRLRESGLEVRYTQMWGFPSTSSLAECQLRHRKNFSDSCYLGVGRYLRREL